MRHTLRLLAGRPAFSAILILTLALGVAAPTAVFATIYAVVLQPLPYPEPDTIVQFRIESRGPRGTAAFAALPAATALEWGRTASTLTGLSLFNDRALTLTNSDGPFRLTGIAATPGLFELLGVWPAIGEPFDSATTDGRQIVLSHASWQQHFGSRPDAVGAVATFDGEPYRVVGVMPAGFAFPTAEAAFWVPLLIPPGGGRGMLLPAVARMRADATLPAVVEEGARLLEEFAAAHQESTLTARTLHDQLVGQSARVLWLLMAVVSAVSMIATANVALLLLARGTARRREFATRLALGASRAQLLRLLTMEALTTAIFGAVAGVALAAALLRLLLSVAPQEMPRLHEAGMAAPVLAFAVALALLSSVVFASLSAGRALAIDPFRALTASGTESPLCSMTSPRRRLAALASVEVALTIVLLSAAALLIRTFVGLVLVDQGFTPVGAVAMQITLPAARYPGAAARMAFHEQLLERLRQLDGVEEVGLAVTMPNRQATARFDFSADGTPVPDEFSMQVAPVRSVTEGFIEAAGMRLLAGRAFRAADRHGSEPVLVLSESLARQHFPDRPAVGELLYSRTGARRVIGVVGDVKPVGDLPAEPSAYVTVRQDDLVLRWFASVTIVARGERPDALVRSLRGAVLSLDPEVPPFNLRMLEDELWQLVAAPRFSASVVACFAFVGLLLAMVGVYGVMSFAVSARTREFGIRMALGATAQQVRWRVIREGMVTVAVGILFGAGASVWTSRLLRRFVADVQPADPFAILAATSLLAMVALGALFIPARRATGGSAIDALRAD